MRLRCEGLVFAAWLVGAVAPVAAAGAQQAPAGADAACACFAKEEAGGGRDSDRRWLFAGLAGLAALSGMPFGGGGAAGIPFGAGGAELPPIADLGPVGPVVVDAPMASPDRAGEQGRPAVGQGGTVPDPGAMVPVSPTQARVGMVPPKTATHLPLLAAAGILLVGSGSVLARRTARQKRRRRRLVAF